jgi:hypothetical protein
MADFHDVRTTARAQNNLAWLLAAMPEPRLRDPARAVELSPKSHSAWNTLGMAQYRAADWKGAIDAFEKSMGLRRGGDGRDWFFLAMAHYQSGSSADLTPEEKERHRTQAREWYDRAVECTRHSRPAALAGRRTKSYRVNAWIPAACQWRTDCAEMPEARPIQRESRA